MWKWQYLLYVIKGLNLNLLLKLSIISLEQCSWFGRIPAELGCGDSAGPIQTESQPDHWETIWINLGIQMSKARCCSPVIYLFIWFMPFPSSYEPHLSKTTAEYKYKNINWLPSSYYVCIWLPSTLLGACLHYPENAKICVFFSEIVPATEP